MKTPLAPNEGAGAPENEIEITPAMIEAGVSAFNRWSNSGEMEEYIVEQIYKAMKKMASV